MKKPIYTAGDPLPSWDTLDQLVDIDPIALRDVAVQLCRHIEHLENPRFAVDIKD